MKKFAAPSLHSSTPDENETSYHDLFHYAPIPLWEADYSQVKSYLDYLRSQGVVDLTDYLTQNPVAINHSLHLIKSLHANRKFLEIFGLDSEEDIQNNLGVIYRRPYYSNFISELVSIFTGCTEFEREIQHHTSAGEALPVMAHWQALPGHETTYRHVLSSLEDIRDRKRAEQALTDSEAHFKGLFENSPVSLWEDDFSQVKSYLDNLREQGVQNLPAYLNKHEMVVEECIGLIRVLDVNQKTLNLFKASTKNQLIENLNRVFQSEMRVHFREELLNIWAGKTEYEIEGINYNLSGEALDISIQWTVLPGHEATFDRVLVSMTDITARKKAETYMRYLGTHDVLTGLCNRHFLEEERTRLERSRRWPVSVIVCDLDGLKLVNDSHGHEAGDDLLRHTAEVLKAAFRSEDLVARVGGDEFVVILPETDEEAASSSLERVNKLIFLNNTFYQGPTLSMSIGAATGLRGASLVDVQRLADDRMYQIKRLKHKKTGPLPG